MSESVGESDHDEQNKTVRIGPREISIPAEWAAMPFEEAIELNPRYEKSGDGPFDYLPMDAVDEEKQTIEYWNEREKKDCTTTWFKNGDTVYAKITPCTENGKIAFIDGLNTELGSGSTEFLVFHPRDGVTDERFVYYLSNLPEFRSVTISLMEGSTGRQRVPSDVFKGGIEVPIPPLFEQRPIAEILSTIDRQIQQTDEVIEEAERLTRGLIQDLVPRGGGCGEQYQVNIGPKQVEIPAAWSVASLERFNRDNARICYGVLKPGENVEEGVPLIKVENIVGNRFNETEFQLISEDLHQEYERSVVTGGEVLISVQGTLGAVAIVPEDFGEANISRTVARITPNDSLDPRWLRYYLISRVGSDYIEVVSSGSTRDSLNIGDLREVPVVRPPIEEQGRICDVIEKSEHKVQKEKRIKKVLQDLKRGLMQDLLTGKVRVDTDT